MWLLCLWHLCLEMLRSGIWDQTRIWPSRVSSVCVYMSLFVVCVVTALHESSSSVWKTCVHPSCHWRRTVQTSFLQCKSKCVKLFKSCRDLRYFSMTSISVGWWNWRKRCCMILNAWTFAQNNYNDRYRYFFNHKTWNIGAVSELAYSTWWLLN